MTSKLGDIKQTASDAVEILRQLGTPGVQETLDKVGKMTITAKEIMQSMESPQWVQNIDNIRKMTEEMSAASSKMENTVRSMRETGVFESAKSLIDSATKTMDAFSVNGEKGQDMKEMTFAFKEMIQSIKLLLDEVRATVIETRTSGAIHEVQQTAKEVRNAFPIVRKGAK
jgi:hypothetical protein